MLEWNETFHSNKYLLYIRICWTRTDTQIHTQTHTRRHTHVHTHTDTHTVTDSVTNGRQREKNWLRSCVPMGWHFQSNLMTLYDNISFYQAFLVPGILGWQGWRERDKEIGPEKERERDRKRQREIKERQKRETGGGGGEVKSGGLSDCYKNKW